MTSVCDVVLLPGWIVVSIVTTVARVRGPPGAAAAGFGGAAAGLHAIKATSSAPVTANSRREKRGIRRAGNDIAAAPLIPRCARDELDSLFCVVPTSSPMRVDRERH